MGRKRLTDKDGLSYYHCLSRVIEKRFIFNEKERERFKKLMRQQEAFSGVRVLTWTCLSNHFHVLVAVDHKNGKVVQEELQYLLDDDAAFLARLKHVYGPKALADVGKMLKRVREATNPDQADPKRDRSVKHLEWQRKRIAQLKQPFLDRMHDLSSFVGEIKQRISQWYNLRTERKGPLWEERFKSVLVQGSPGVLATVAAYIDLNAVRAGIVKEPKDWRWCGYAEAAAAQCLARKGIYEVLGEEDAVRRDGDAWRKVHKRYRELLIGEAIQLRDEEGRIVRKGLTPDEAEDEETRGFELPRTEILRHRVRYFADGLALGTEAYLEKVFRRTKRGLKIKRKVGPRLPKMKGLGDLRTLRDLRGG